MFLKFEQEARNAGRGLWAAKPPVGMSTRLYWLLDCLTFAVTLAQTRPEWWLARTAVCIGIKSKVARKYRDTTDSNHSLSVAENLLNREFHAEKRNQKWVSDITCVWSDEGWL